MKLELRQLIQSLALLKDKIISSIHFVDYIGDDRQEDYYEPWLIFFTFESYDKFLEIEGDFDGDHIKLKVSNLKQLRHRLDDNQTGHWRVYESKEWQQIDKLIGKTILELSLAIEDSYLINEDGIKEQFIAINQVIIATQDESITIYECGLGLMLSDSPDVDRPYDESFRVLGIF